MRKLFDCARHVNSFNKHGADESWVRPPLRLSPQPLGLPPGQYAFKYTYPLSNSAQIVHEITAEMSAGDILELAAQDYRTIYMQEDAACREPTGNIPGMLNRDKSNGPYGIWGHSITDLYFEGAHVDDATKVIEFDIGS